MTNPISSMDSVYYDIQTPVTVSMNDIVAITSLDHPWMAYTHQSNPLSQYPWMTYIYSNYDIPGPSMDGLHSPV